MDNKVYNIVTDNIISMLDKGIIPWHQPWRGQGRSIPKNAWGRKYRGINTFILAVSAAAHNYKSSYWLTFKQVGERGGKVNEGEKSTLVVFWKKLTVENKDENGNVNPKKPTKNIMMLRYFLVFNLDQTTGVKMTKAQAAEYDEIDTLINDDAARVYDDAEAIFGTYLSMDTAPSWADDSVNGAYYIPSKDEIHVPDRGLFLTPEGWYATNFHEMAHSTAHQTRLNRKGMEGGFDHFGTEKYAAEELVAEMTAAFLCADAGIDNTNTVENTVAYIQSWRQKLSEDPTLIVKTAGQAQKAADHIMGVTYEEHTEEAS